MNKNNTPLGSYEHMAKQYADVVDDKPIHAHYERPGTWSLLPRDLNGLKVLDLGCGSGWYAKQLFDCGCDVTAVDASQIMVDLTKKRLDNQIICLKANIEEPLNFAMDGEFDIVIAPLVIHYLEEYEPLFREVNRALKGEGIFIFSTQNPRV